MVLGEKYSSAKDFLEALDISKDWWLPNSLWNSPWIFRGQCDAGWGLTPKAWRTDNSAEIKRLQTLKRRFVQNKRVEVEEALSKANKDYTPTELNRLIEAYSQGRAEFRLIFEFISSLRLLLLRKKWLLTYT